MRLVASYNKELITLAFERNLQNLVRPSHQNPDGITPMEIRYLAEKLAETCFGGISDCWIFSSGALHLVNLVPEKASRTELEQCEWTANQVLFLEGLVFRPAARESLTYRAAQESRTRVQYAETLYRHAAAGTFHDAGEKLVLNAMSEHALEWPSHLGRLEGNDFQDILRGQSELAYRLST